MWPLVDGIIASEQSGVYNWVDDCDGDGREDCFKQDMYPESTAFSHLGIMHLLRMMAGTDQGLEPRSGQ